MRSDLHTHLQHKGQEYLLNNGFWVRTQEMPTPVGIIDVWGVKNNHDYQTVAIEVKVSRSDYRSRSQKYKEARPEYLANYCYILCPEYLVGNEYDSPNWGIIWWKEKTNRLQVVRKPIRFEQTEKQKLQIMISLFHNRANNPDQLLREVSEDLISHPTAEI